MKFVDGIPETEIIPESDIKNAADLNKIGLGAFYQERLHQFRAKVMQLMMKNGAIDPNISWAVFNCSDEANDGPIMLQPRKEICIVAGTLINQEETEPVQHLVVRLMINEAFTVERGTDYLVTDMIVDAEGDSQYFVGAYAQLAEELGGDFEPDERSTVALFFHVDGILGLYSPTNRGITFPPMEGVRNVSKLSSHVKPFGHYSHLEDRIQALNVAQATLDLVYDSEPAYTSKTI